MTITHNIIVIDAIDGAGKDTLAINLIRELEKQGHKIFDAIEYQKQLSSLPTLATIGSTDVLLVCEPTYVAMPLSGVRLRDHIVPGSPTTQRELVKLYAQDREMLYLELVIPFLKTGGTVIQVRGLCSSLAYQRTVDPTITIDDILAEEGNSLELAYAPSAILVMSLSLDEARKRLASRGEKIDPSMFDGERIQQGVRERYQSAELREVFTNRGTTFIDLDAGGTKEDNLSNALQLLSPYLDRQ